MPSDPPFRNDLLNHLAPADLDLLRPHFERSELGVRRRLADAGRPIEHVYFLETGIASITTGIRHEPPIEVGIVGREGVVNVPVLLGTDRSPTDSFMQVGGTGLALSAARLRAAIDLSSGLNRALLRYAQAFMVQTAATVLANGRATVLERLARWLIMAQDRLDGDELPLTHEFLSMMLGVRRPGVTVALRELEGRALVRRGRVSIAVLDRDGLVEVANGYYGTPEAELRRLFGDLRPK
jgi:CRP-like cAMP-binding protein